MVFRLFWILTRKTCVFAGKFLAGLSKILSACPVEHLQIKFSEWKSWKLEEFRNFFEVFGTMAEKFFRVGKTAIDVRGNSLWKIFFKREKFDLFSDCERMFTSSENFCQICGTRNLCIGGSFWGKTVFEI